jgi:hydroxysqualene synthase
MNVAVANGSASLLEAIDGKELTGRAWSIDEAYDYCKRLTRSHYENFPVGSILIPGTLRKHVYAIYCFARVADDFADEGYDRSFTERERLEALDRWLELLIDSTSNRSTHPVFIALADTRSRYDLPRQLFEDLLSAFKQDVVVRRYDNSDQLLDYCRRSANPIGRLILLLFGYRDEQLHSWSDAICTALQLTNHWQDVEVDLLKDRIYLPRESLDRFGVSENDLRSKRADQRFKELLRREVAGTRMLFERGKPLCGAVAGRLGLELRATWLGGTRILDRIERNGYDVFGHRPRIDAFDKVRIIVTALRKGAFRRS